MVNLHISLHLLFFTIVTHVAALIDSVVTTTDSRFVTTYLSFSNGN